MAGCVWEQPAPLDRRQGAGRSLPVAPVNPLYSAHVTSTMSPSHRLTAVAIAVVSVLLSACGGTASDATAPLFTDLPSDSTGVAFVNTITEDDSVNVLAYEYLYNGGGVALGDVNGDDRPDLFFTGNRTADRLYLNTGGLRFRDVTEAAGVAGPDGWTTGVTMADVNGDGRLDIYVCRSGWMEDPDRRRNLLYINQGADTDGMPRFSEEAAAYGLDDASNSTHATFFDYDRDGDLDLYLLNHPTKRFIGRFELDTAREQKDTFAGDKLFRNDAGSFTDVSDEAGIIGNAIGYGLSATVSDLNRDGWPDLYVANDYIEDDYLYINQGDGTFSEEIRARLDHTSYSSMGADIADINNDGRLDIYTLDMLAEDHYRQKILKGPQDYRFYRDMLSRGYHYQFMRNMLHLARTDTVYSEIGQLAGVSTTDWSWAALLADFDLDGFNDLYVTNGYRRDYTNLDFLNNVLFGNLDFIKYLETDDPRYADLYGLTQQMPSTPIPNYAFRNRGELTFEDVSAAWGLDARGFSHGAAYGDLDGDGDLDLVVSHINAPASIYRNETRSGNEAAQRTGRRYLRIRLAGESGNRHGIGAKVTVRAPSGETDEAPDSRAIQYREMQPARGFQSSVEPALTVGLGAAEAADVRVWWTDGRVQTRRGVAANQTITLRQADAREAAEASTTEAGQLGAEEAELAQQPLLVDQTRRRGLVFTHQENLFVDFDREPLMPRMVSRLGPALAVGDADGDGREDVFIGGARGQRAALFLQQPGGAFERTTVPVLSAHRGYEDVAAAFFDANGDGALDLYVVSGGADSMEPSFYQDRLYLNDGSGGFQAAPSDALPAITSSGGAVAPHDVDGDGDTDLFVGGRVAVGAYPEAPRSYLLANDGTGRFTDMTARASAGLTGGGLERPGMVTAAVWADVAGDGAAELILAGEWMPVRVFARQANGTFTEISDALGLSDTGGGGRRCLPVISTGMETWTWWRATGGRTGRWERAGRRRRGCTRRMGTEMGRWIR